MLQPIECDGIFDGIAGRSAGLDDFDTLESFYFHIVGQGRRIEWDDFDGWVGWSFHV